MRIRNVLLVVVAAAAGAGIGLAAVAATGRLGAATTNATYVVSEAVAPSGASAPLPAPLPAGFDPAAIYRRRSPGVVTVFAYAAPAGGHYTTASQGSGFVVSRAGVILTNAHVVTDAGAAASGEPVHAADKVVVEFSDGDRASAEIVGWDLFDDVAVLRVRPAAHQLVVVPLGSSATVAVGEPVAAIGSPFGNSDSISVGVVSATRSIASLTSQYEITDAIQTDASINHGNSGGPLFDAAGRVIGINAQLRGGSQAAGIGFAVPIDAAKRSMAQLLADGKVAYAYVGIGTGDLTPGLARRYSYAVARGALVTSVERGSAAARAGLRPGGRAISYEGKDVTIGGDVIVAIDGAPVRSAADLVQIVAQRLEPGDESRFTVVRAGTRRVVVVRLDERPLR